MISYTLYKQLLNNGDQKQYDILLDGLINHDDEIILKTSNFNDVIFDYLMLDQPQLFHCDSISMISSYSITKIIPHYILSIDDYIRMRKQCIDVSKRIVKKCVGSDYEKELIIHDWICSNCTYKDIGSAAHTIVGPLINGYGVCEGFSKLFKLLMDMVNIESALVLGSDLQKNESHAWNYVYIEREWYNIDITFDLSLTDGKMIRYDYFNLDDIAIGGDHLFNNNYLRATSMRCNYHYRNGLVANTIEDASRSIDRYRVKDDIYYFRLIKPTNGWTRVADNIFRKVLVRRLFSFSGSVSYNETQSIAVFRIGCDI